MKSSRFTYLPPIVRFMLPGFLFCLAGWVTTGCGEESGSVDAGERPDVILITIDTLRADTLGYAGSDLVRTPFLDRIASEGMVYHNAHAHSTVTLPSHVNILTGKLPFQHGVRDNAAFELDASEPTIASYLRKAGYVTSGIVGAFPLDRRFGLHHSFDHYDDRVREAGRAFVMAERTADEVLEIGLEWWRSTGPDRDRFMWLHLYDPHFPYETHGSDCEETDCYYREIEYVDQALHRHLESLIGESENLMIVITGDHGEALGEHGEMTHGVFAYEETLRIPLLLWESKGEPRGEEQRFVRHVDIVPTILERVGEPIPGELAGESLFELEGDRDTYFESLSTYYTRGWAPLVGVLHAKHKYIELPIPEMYDLPEDPEEDENIYGTERRLMFEMRELLEDLAPSRAATEANRPVSREEEATLLSLGYVTGNDAKSEFTDEDDPKNLIHLDEKLHDALGEYQRGDVDAAAATLRELIAIAPDLEVAQRTLATVLQLGERHREALESIEGALKNGKGSPETKQRYGMILSETGRAGEAVEVLKEFADSRDPDLLNAYGVALADLGRFDEAMAQFAKALSIDETNAQAYENRGITYLKMDQIEPARQELMRALALQPNLTPSLTALGVIHMRQGRPAEAISAWQKAVSIDPKQYDALLNIGLVAGSMGRSDVAREALIRFRKSAPPSRYAADLSRVDAMLRELERRGG